MFCRLCVFEFSNEAVVSIFCDDEESNVTKLVVKYLYLEITKYDEFSTKICFDCKRHIQEFHEFFEKVQNRQRKIKECYLEQSYELACNANETKSANFEYIEENLVDFKDVETNSANLTPLESHEFELADDKSESGGTVNNIDTVMEPLTLSLKIRSQNTIEEILPHKNKKYRKDHPSKESNIKARKFDTLESKTILSPEKERESDNFIEQNIELKCALCEDVLTDYKTFKSHFRKKHNRKAFITCCGLHLTQRWRLVDHLRLHVNPNQFKCKYCEKTLTTQLGIQAHIANFHGSKYEKKHECEICQKRFNRKDTLSVHLISHTQEANHPCELCEKCFKTSQGLKNHIENLHRERKSFHICHICGKELKSKHNLQIHIEEVHAEIPKSKCSFCGIWVSTSYLKKHEQYHVLKEVECDLCGKVFPSEKALRTHKRGNSHKERNFSCTFCEKAFKEKRFLKEHIAIHTGQKDYSCKYCQREFRSQLNMRKHIRQQHPKEYAQEQAQKFGSSIKGTVDIFDV